MIKTQIIKEGKEPIAVIVDINEYNRLKEIEEDYQDYFSALEVKMKNKEWISHTELKKQLKIEK